MGDDLSFIRSYSQSFGLGPMPQLPHIPLPPKAEAKAEAGGDKDCGSLADAPRYVQSIVVKACKYSGIDPYRHNYQDIYSKLTEHRPQLAIVYPFENIEITVAQRVAMFNFGLRRKSIPMKHQASLVKPWPMPIALKTGTLQRFWGLTLS